MQWVTRERSQVDRIADRKNLMERLVELTADFLRAPRDQTFAAAQRERATVHEQLKRRAVGPVPAPGRPDVSSDRTIVFVCMNGTATSRLAAAFFNQAAPIGWRAVSAALAPGAALSPTAEGLLEGSSAKPFLDREAPRKLETVGRADRLIAVSNPHIRFEVPEAETWRLHSAEVDERLRDEIHERVNALTRSLREQ